MRGEKILNFLKAFKKTWIFAGIIFFAFVLISFIKVKIAFGQGNEVKTIFFAAGLYVFIIYLITTLIMLLSGEIIKRMKQMYLYEKAPGIKGIVRRTNEKTSGQ